MNPTRFGLALLLAASALLPGCHTSGPARQYEVHGQILDVRPSDHTVTIRHDDIKGFMPAMTMPFKVKEERLLAGRRRGDLVIATLVVTDTDAYLTTLEVVGHADPAPASAAPPPPPVDILRPGSAVPDIELVGGDGGPFRFSSLRGSIVALTFVYTRCSLPEFCPLMDRQFRALASRVAAVPALRSTARLLSISFDPEYDIPSVLAAHGRAAGADGRTWRFVTADRGRIDDWAPRFGLVLMRDDPNAITHNLRTAIVDRQGRLVKIYNGSDWTVDEVMAELQRLTTGS
jgi:protein SCO1